MPIPKAECYQLVSTTDSVVHRDVASFLNGSADGFDVVLIDPPFNKNLVAETCQALEIKGWLNPYAKIYVETERALVLSGLPENWQLLKHKTAGDVAYYSFARLL